MRYFPTIQAKPSSSIEEFITYWRKLYVDTNERLYSDNIKVSKFDAKNITQLFHWKNGMTLTGSGGKEISLNNKILARLDVINKLKNGDDFDIDEFNNEFKDVSAVWRIFLLHIIQPERYPIYDQHTHRTYTFINNQKWDAVTNVLPDKIKLDFYFKEYLPFIQQLEVEDLKALDEALFAFGQFLNTRKQGRLFSGLL
jgi:hypothetical protein